MATWNIMINGKLAHQVNGRKAAREAVKRLKTDGKDAKAVEDVARSYARSGPVHDVIDTPVTVPTPTPAVLEETAPDGGPVAEPTWVRDGRFHEATAIIPDGASVQITSLPVGCWFTLGGRNGRYLGEVGGDAKVEWEGKLVTWSGATAVARAAAPTTSATAVAGVQPVVNSHRAIGVPRQTIFGHPMTRVVMWMGKNGFTTDVVHSVLAKLGLTSTNNSVATFVRSGIKGDRGDVAPLTDEQASKLREMAS